MKSIKHILFIIGLIVISSVAQAQFFKASLVSAANFAQVDGDHIAGYNKLGLHLGISISHEIDDIQSVGFELAYAQKGSKLVNDPKAVIQPNYIIKSSYIDFPLFYERKVGAIENLSVQTGVSIGANLSGTIDDGPRVSNANFQSLELAFLVGGTYQLSDKLGFRIRHSNSISKISNDLPVNSRRLFNRPGMYNRWYTVGLVYQL